MELKELLGGYNCGGCGYNDCEECANAILKGETDASVCMLLEEGAMEKISELLKQFNNKKDKQ